MIVKNLRLAALMATLAALVACGGGSGSGGYTFTGVAASGAAIAQATVTVKCKVGSGSALTAADGSYAVTVAQGQAPCMMQASQPSTGLTLHSMIEEGSNIANITPVTELIVAHLFKKTPKDVFDTFDADRASEISASGLLLSQAIVLEATKGWRLATPSQEEFDPFKAPLRSGTTLAGGNNFDGTLDALMASVIAADTSLPALAEEMIKAQTSQDAKSRTTALMSTSLDSLQDCSAARSGPIWLLDFSNSQNGPRRFTVDYKQGTLTDEPTEGSATSSQITLSATEYCSFSAAVDNKPTEFRVSDSGLMLWKNADYAGLAIPRQSLLNQGPLLYQTTQASLAYLVASVGEQDSTHAIANRFEWNDGKATIYGCDFTDISNPACNKDLSRDFTVTCLPKLGADAREEPLECRRSDNAAAGQAVGFVSGATATTVIAVSDFPILVPVPGFGVVEAKARGLMIVTQPTSQAMPSAGDVTAQSSRWFVGLGPTGAPLAGYAASSSIESVNLAQREYSSLENGNALLNQVDKPAIGMLYSRPVVGSGYRLSIPSAEGWTFGIDATATGPLPRASVRTRPR
jgi:hypothetical protein